MGTGEKVDEFDVFHPDRMASILGMGDVVSLVEKAQETIDEKAERMAEKMRKAEFNLDDFLKQMQQVKKMGSLGSIVSMLPGASGIEIGDEEEENGPHRSHHPVDDQEGARDPAPAQRQPPQARGQWFRRTGARRQRTAQAIRPDAEDDEDDAGGKGRKMMKAMKAQMAENGGQLPGM